MALQEQFRTQGNFLFRYRSFFPIPLFIAGLAYFCYIQYYGVGIAISESVYFIGLGVGLFGLFVRTLIIGYVPSGTSGRNREKQVAEVLNTKGMYSVVRHPLYVGNYFMWLGVAIITGSVWFVLVFSLVYWIYYERIMYAEEAFLRDKFGNTYLEWANGVPSFIPDLSKWQNADSYFSVRNVLKREYIGFFNLIVVIYVFHLIASLFANNGSIVPVTQYDWIWLGILAFAVLVFIVIRILHKGTKVLDVEGR
jgi:protein-S-isoprenylcysteine O-methyltransferase Ste14